MDENSGGPAFPAAWGNPEQGGDYVPGMTLRDWIAGRALPGIIANPNRSRLVTIEQMAGYAYLYADAMLAARRSTSATKETSND